MTPIGRGDITELARSLGIDALRREAEAMGLSPRGDRCKCPFPGCAHKGANRDRDAQLFGGNHPRAFCFACNSSGDIIDLVMAHRGLDQRSAITALTGGAPLPPRTAPELRLVAPSAPVDDPDKLTPAEVRRLWEAMAVEDSAGLDYLRGRGLEEGVELGLLRFVTEAHPNGGLKAHARRRYRIGALLTDVVGNARGIQIRMAGEPVGRTPKLMSAKGSSTKGFFGHPELIEDSPIVVVAEGLADTVAASIWTRDRAGVTVVGAGGKGRLPLLAEELGAAGIDITGKYFVLLVQNDRPKNDSRKYFLQLAQQLKRAAARPVFVTTPDQYKDTAELLHARPDTDWPPAELQRAILPQPGDDTPIADRPVTPPGAAVAIPAVVRTELFAQNFTTLCALLDDPVSRESIMGADGELSWCEMRQAPRFCGRPLSDSDYLSIRLGLEAQARSTDGKPLKFGLDDITQAVTLLSKRKTMHPVREWLSNLKWDNEHRLEVLLPQAFGHPAGSFEGILLKRWFISAVARAMTPGCKADNMLILVGPQGTGKSSFFEAIGGEWFTSDKVLVDDKDSKLVMRRAWIIEWAELDAMRRARDQEAIKAFLSQRIDQFRPPYGRDVIEVPRSSIFAGTTNDRGFLNDPSGSRRFHVIEVLARIDLEWVRGQREQLFAEALARFRAGEQWHLTDQEDAELALRNKTFESTDAWHDVIEDWLSQRLAIEVTTAQVLKEALGKDVDSWTDTDQRRVAKVLQQLGWKPTGRTQYLGKLRRAYGFEG